jgi:hypothetical protein
MVETLDDWGENCVPRASTGTSSRQPILRPDRGRFFARLRGEFSAPKRTITETIEHLNKELNTALANPKMKARLADLGGAVLAGSPADFGKLIADETEKWRKVIRTANIKPE